MKYYKSNFVLLILFTDVQTRCLALPCRKTMFTKCHLRNSPSTVFNTIVEETVAMGERCIPIIIKRNKLVHQHLPQKYQRLKYQLLKNKRIFLHQRCLIMDTHCSSTRRQVKPRPISCQSDCRLGQM